MLYTILPPKVSSNINNLIVQFNDSIEDSFIWSHNKNRVYTTKSGYDWLLCQSATTTTSTSHHSWSWIWKLRLPEKYKFLVWLTCHDAAPTLYLLMHMNIAQSTVSTHCDQQEETFLHYICDCLHSFRIWCHLGFNSDDFFAEINTYVSLKNGLTGFQYLAFSAGVWWVWRHRNLMGLNNEVWSRNHLTLTIQNSMVINCTSMHHISLVDSFDKVVKWN